ncbi:coiled-coil domain-containing protein 57 isoform X3 [Micropterus salmoides]|uniref:coiled-coil domain-containing protein 57 isoform X3 n=1 Tax=Micropterus salmoides TaxID=27706 RepID=UPI0018EDC3AB|nr:coiled-coil domain-containing protein 57 isoform X3 [Micropterus salmoides]
MVYCGSTMQSEEDSGIGNLEAQLACKEREWKELQAARFHQLENSLKKAQEEWSSLSERHLQLREDFQFNLAILDERDRELERYDIIFAKALTVEHNRLEEQRAREIEERQEELNKSAAQYRLQLDELKRSMAGEIQQQKKEYERMKSDLQCMIQEVEAVLTLQRQEMTAAFDSELRQREYEFNLKMDEMRAVELSCDLKVKLLSKETEIHCQAQLQATEALKASKEFCQKIQTKLQLKDQEIKDLTAVKDYRIKELGDELKWMENKLKMQEDDHIKKYEDVVCALKEYDLHLEAQCQGHTEQLQKAEKQIVILQENMEVLAAQTRSKEEDQQEAMEQKDETIQSLRRELDKTRTGWDRYISQVSSEMVFKDTEIITLRESETKLRTELERCREEMERYKQQLSASLKRERALKQMQIQVELEWQRRCEDMKVEHCLANEQLIQELTQARDQANAELKEKEQELQDLTVLLHCVKKEGVQATQDLTPNVDSPASEKIRHLQEQNSIMRAVITHMRKDMEGLSHLLPHPQAQPQASSAQPVHHPGAPATSSIAPTANTQMAAGDLCLEKCANPSALTKQEFTVAHSESACANIIEQSALVRQLQDHLCLRQQQSSGLMHGDVFENVQGAKSSLPLLRTRLKQAAFCIARLSREKQQLIEMGNHLRAQITTAGLHEPEKDSSAEKQGDQHDRLSALEQLQYQLTTQELQYALRQRACTDLILTETSNRGPATNGAANPWSLGRKTTDRPETSKNKETTPPISQSQNSLDMGPHPLSGLTRSELSSEESLRLLKELWEILDHGLSPSVFSEDELSWREMAESGGDGVHPPTKVQQSTNPFTSPSKH